MNLTFYIRLEIQDVKDDGNDPLRHKISHACDFIEQAGKSGGKTLIHCVGSISGRPFHRDLIPIHAILAGRRFSERFHRGCVSHEA